MRSPAEAGPAGIDSPILHSVAQSFSPNVTECKDVKRYLKNDLVLSSLPQ